MGSDQYDPEELELDVETRLQRRLGVRTPNTVNLASVFLGDLTPEPGGVNWWYGSVPLRTSILIGDLVFQAQEAIPQIFVEAATCRLDYTDLLQETAERFRRHVKGGGDPARFPGPPRGLADELAGVREDIALLGFFTALGRVLDHLAAVLIGVLDLPMSLIRADWNGVIKILRSSNDASWLFSAIDEAGPSGWLDWCISIRNSLSHRPPQLSLKQPYVYGFDLVVIGVDPADRLEMVAHLPRQPGLSFVEAVRSAVHPKDAYLSESAGVTLDRVQRSVAHLAEAISAQCGVIWTDRRGVASVQANHEKQWKQVEPQGQFDGYAPGTIEFQPDFIILGGSTLDRVRAAHLDDPRRNSTWGDESAPRQDST